MSILTKSVPNIKNPKQKLETNRSSANKANLIYPEVKSLKQLVTKTINSPNQNKKSNPSIKTTRSNNSPIGLNLYSSQRESGLSYESIEKISFFDQPSEENLERPVFLKKSTDIQAELKQCRKQNLILQAKIDKITEKLNPKKLLNEDISLTRARSALEKRENLKIKGLSESENNIENLEKIQKIYQEKIALMLKEIKNAYQEEINSLVQQHEIKLKNKISELEGECDRKLEQKDGENFWLKTQNEKLKQRVEELSSKLELKENKFGKVFEDKTNDQNRKYNEVFKQYMQLQQDYLKIKQNGLCQNCKAVKNTSSELTQKINRIRAFIDSSN